MACAEEACPEQAIFLKMDCSITGYTREEMVSKWEKILAMRGVMEGLVYEWNEGKSALCGGRAILSSEHEPEVALLDIGLPNKDGYQVARELRGKLPSIKLIAISGWGQEEYKRRSVEAGFNHHLVKPIDVEELRQLLDS